MATFYGYLHSSPFKDISEKESAERTEDVLLRLFHSDDAFAPYKGKLAPRGVSWRSFRFISKVPLKSEDPDMIGGPYPYPFYVFVNRQTSNIVIGSERYPITNAVIQKINLRLPRHLIRNSIDVDKIAKHILDSKSRGLKKSFYVTNISIDITSFGNKVEGMTLSGSDILGSSFFSDHVTYDYLARNIGLMLPGRGVESARLYSNGGIQFYTDRLGELGQCLGFARSINAFQENA